MDGLVSETAGTIDQCLNMLYDLRDSTWEGKPSPRRAALPRWLVRGEARKHMRRNYLRLRNAHLFLGTQSPEHGTRKLMRSGLNEKDKEKIRKAIDSVEYVRSVVNPANAEARTDEGRFEHMLEFTATLDDDYERLTVLNDGQPAFVACSSRAYEWFNMAYRLRSPSIKPEWEHKTLHDVGGMLSFTCPLLDAA